MDEIHIGKQIKAVVEERGFSITEFAKRINKSRENAYSIFSRKTIDTGLLLKISKVLEYDFFKQFSSDANSQMELIESLKNEINLLKELNNLLREKGAEK
jgi:transcriptional regulator with XRE-family HTH domain